MRFKLQFTECDISNLHRKPNPNVRAMDITPTPTAAATTINNVNIPISATTATTKSPEHDTETPTRITTPTPTPITTTPTPKALSFSNGVLKRIHHSHSHSHHHHHVAVTYKECLKNHAANLGGHALDGCGEFMPSPTATAADPSSIKCAACGCHRNFHRREPEEPPISTATHVIEYQPHHRHQPLPPPPFSNRSPNSASPPPISSSYYPSAPHMLLALSTGLAAPPENAAAPNNTAMVSPGSHSRKRFRTKFSQEQKEKMLRFAEKVGWKMQKRDDDLVKDFCNDIGVDRSVLKVWMHNNKNTFAKRDNININNNDINNITPNHATAAKSFLVPLEEHNPINNNNDNNADINAEEDPIHHYQNEGGVTVRANGSSSSS